MKPIIGILGRAETSKTDMPLVSVQEKERIAIIKVEEFLSYYCPHKKSNMLTKNHENYQD